MAGKTPYTVIVADDEDELREAVCMMTPWQDFGFCLVGSASNGLDALQLVEKLEPDLLLTDIRMPFISGIELARQVREIRPATNIAFLSGYDDFEYAQQAIQYNIISYMLKPLTMEGGGSGTGGGVRAAVRPAPGPGRPAVLYSDGVRPAE